MDAKDLQEVDFGTGYTDALIFRGQSKLSEQAIRYSFDTSVNPHGNLTYKIDFDLGQDRSGHLQGMGRIHDDAHYRD